MSNKKLRLSNSALDKYNLCPLLYKYHYIDKIRSTRKSSALLFGIAVDEALNTLLIDKDKLKAHLALYTSMRTWKRDYTVDFFKKDLDPQSIMLQDWDYIDQFDAWDEDKRTHAVAWYSLFRKGQQFIEAYAEQILPKIKKVISIQEKLEITNEHGDKIVGLPDVTVELEDGDVFEVIVDHKTSGKSYSRKMIEQSQQLHLYAFIKKIPKIAYVVMRKDYNKKGLMRPIQLLIDHVDTNFQHEVLFRFDEAIEKIKNEEFPKTDNKNNCKFQFGKPCIYYELCHNNKQVDECDHLERKGENK